MDVCFSWYLIRVQVCEDVNPCHQKKADTKTPLLTKSYVTSDIPNQWYLTEEKLHRKFFPHILN
jgi:hypothetical protein